MNGLPLMEPTLVPDCGGAIEEIAIAVVPGCFGDEPLLKAVLAALGNFALTLPRDVVLYVLGTEPTRNSVEHWLEGLGLACDTAFVEADLSTASDTSDFWVQDPLLVFAGAGAGKYLRQDCENPGDHAVWLTRTTGIPVEKAAFHLAGGNLLVGPDFRLTGQDSIDLTQQIIGREGGGEMAFERLAAIDSRPLFVAGYGYGAQTLEKPRAGAWNDPYRFRQYGGHIDRFIALTGLKTADGRPQDHCGRCQARTKRAFCRVRRDGETPRPDRGTAGISGLQRPAQSGAVCADDRRPPAQGAALQQSPG